MKNNKHKEFSIYFWFNWCGFTLHWDCYDPVQSVMGWYRLAFYWRSVEPRIWWELYAFGFRDSEATTATLKYSRGWKGKKVAGWTLQGPLIKFISNQV